jgi:hypothetical protein
MQVFDGVLDILDGQLWVASENDEIGPDLWASFLGQQNGLLGAAEQGTLRLIFGKADGDVGLSVYVEEREPELDPSWEECVEVSFSPVKPVVALFDWDGQPEFEIPLGDGTYRVRYTARDMDAGHSYTKMDVYALWFWPAPPAPDAIVKQSSESAAYWHAAIARETSVRSQASED